MIAALSPRQVLEEDIGEGWHLKVLLSNQPVPRMAPCSERRGSWTVISDPSRLKVDCKDDKNTS